MIREPDWGALDAGLVEGLGAPKSSHERLARLLVTIRQVVPFDAAALLRLEGDHLVPAAVLGLGDEVMARRFGVTSHPRLEQLLASSAPVRFASDPSLPDPYDGLVEGTGDLLPVHDCMGGRLMVDGRLWGVLTLDALTLGTFERYRPMLPGLVAWAEDAVLAAETMAALLERVDRQRRLNEALLGRERSRRDLIGSSPAVELLRSEIATVAPSDLTVLVLGETGVGKELVAEKIHAGSLRSQGPLVHVNCAALPDNLAESELFGHEKGAFTGANRDRAGKFELAHGGTLLLDEVGELAPSVQSKLLRVLQSGEVQRPGSDRTHHVDVRILAATNRDLRDEVSKGRFRADLYHRLSVFPLSVPPLRERGTDVLAIAGAFLEENQRRLGARNLRLTRSAKAALVSYSWPGNVRELEHLVSRAALRAVARQGRAVRFVTIDAEALGLQAGASEPSDAPRSAQASSGSPTIDAPDGRTLRAATDDFQRRWIEKSLLRHQGNQAAVAREAGVHRSNLVRLLKRLGLSVRD
jgi:anaerobic nitric oxide reductase transcription regulator